MNELCIYKSIITYLKLSSLHPKRVRGIHMNPRIILGREPVKNEDVYCYWVELDNKVYSEYGIIDMDIWNNKYKDYKKEFGNIYGLLNNELEQLNEKIITMITCAYNENNFNKKKKIIALLEVMWSNI